MFLAVNDIEYAWDTAEEETTAPYEDDKTEKESASVVLASVRSNSIIFGFFECIFDCFSMIWI